MRLAARNAEQSKRRKLGMKRELQSSHGKGTKTEDSGGELQVQKLQSTKKPDPPAQQSRDGFSHNPKPALLSQLATSIHPDPTPQRPQVFPIHKTPKTTTD